MAYRFTLAVLISLQLALFAGPAVAQDSPLGDGSTSNNVVRHQRRSGMPFPRATSDDKYLETGMIYRIPETSRDEKLKDVPRKSNYLMKLPDCAENRTRRVEIYHYSLQTANYDITFYNPNDRNQVVGVKKIKGKTVPYQGGRLLDLKKKPEDAFQMLAMPMNVECLPTRFTVVLEDNRRFIEHREGADAWKAAAAKN